jgi:hypothetical protein
MKSEPLDSQPAETPNDAESKSKQWLVPFLLLVPAVGTLLLPRLGLEEAIQSWIIISSPVVGIICGFLISRPPFGDCFDTGVNHILHYQLLRVLRLRLTEKLLMSPIAPDCRSISQID